MRTGLRCIFQKVCRIPGDFAARSIFKGFLEEPPQKLLQQVAKSQVTYLSPFDSAAILHKLLKSTGNRRISELRRDPLYRPVVTKVVSSVELYRQELLGYFLEKFFKLHDTQAIKALTAVFVSSGAVRSQNLNQLVELLYYLAHHIPKELRPDSSGSSTGRSGTGHSSRSFKGSLNALQDPDSENIQEHVRVYCEFVRQLQQELLAKVGELRDNVLLYKLVTSLIELPETGYTGQILAAIKLPVKSGLERNSWDSKRLKKIVVALVRLDLVDDELLKRIIGALELNQDSLDTRDIHEVLLLLETLNQQ